MGRKSKYETFVQPYLKEISEWYTELDERQIATEKLGIAVSTFENYKKKYPELKEALKRGKSELVSELKSSLKKKAKGFYYEETKTCIREVDGRQVKTIEKYKKYAQPDTGALHLLLKNLDESWHNDDIETINMKKEQLKIAREKMENDSW